MKLKLLVESVLQEQKRTLTWLATELDRTPEGLKLSLEKGTIKYTDIEKMADILSVPAGYFFNEDVGAGGQSIRGNRNLQAQNSNIAAEPPGAYLHEKDALKQRIVLLESTVKDKEHIIELLKAQIK